MNFNRRLIRWYKANKRDLPWRNTRDPYRVWVSEVILQQTRVEQGLAYYQRFIEQFPDIDSLAYADEDEVMKVWQGLGYYTRARNMHRAARDISKNHNSRFPASYDEIIKLHGIGDYSASAISSIVYDEPRPVIDGNVKRVVARHRGIKEDVDSAAGKSRIRDFLNGNIDTKQPGDFNQAIMELGAMICKPKQPLCSICPVSEDCIALRENLVEGLPRRRQAKQLITRYFNYLIIFNEDQDARYVWLQKRTGNDIWKNLYEFPLIETDKELSFDELKKTRDWKNFFGKSKITILPEEETVRHLLSHRQILAHFFFINSNRFDTKNGVRVNMDDLHKYPVPRLIENILKKIPERPGIFLKNPDKS